MDIEFPNKDRHLFQLLIDHQLESVEDLAKGINEPNPKLLYYRINSFCERYQCSSQVQILDWNQIGLHSFFRLTSEPIVHPYAVREYKLLSGNIAYLTQFVTPNIEQLMGQYPEIYRLTRIYRPTNNISLLFDEARTLSFVDEWLLNLKEVMVEQEMGDIIYQPDKPLKNPITIDKSFLDQLATIYTRGQAGRFDTRWRSKQINFIQDLEGFLSPYLNIVIPNMTDYILILNKVTNPTLFIGGFLGKFPLVELYETSDALICRLQLPEPNYSKFSLILFTHLLEVCLPYLWILLEDKHIFRLQEQWENNHWIPLQF